MRIVIPAVPQPASGCLGPGTDAAARHAAPTLRGEVHDPGGHGGIASRPWGAEAAKQRGPGGERSS